MIVVEPTQTVRQAERSRSEQHGERIRQPFRQEVDTSLLTLPDIGANVQERMSGERFQQPRAQPAARVQTHPIHRECHQSDERARPFPQVQLEGHGAPQPVGIHREVQHERAIPIGNQQRFTTA
jgi:hypothetical protein